MRQESYIIGRLKNLVWSSIFFWIPNLGFVKWVTVFEIGGILDTIEYMTMCHGIVGVLALDLMPDIGLRIIVNLLDTEYSIFISSSRKKATFWLICFIFMHFQFSTCSVCSFASTFVRFLYWIKWTWTSYGQIWCHASKFSARIESEFGCSTWTSISFDCEFQSTVWFLSGFHQHYIYTERWRST